MAVDITNITRMVFGVNYLGANGGTDIKALWNSRFAAEEAYLLNAEPQENPRDIFQRFKLLLRERAHEGMPLPNCMLVFFVDYTAELQKMTKTAVWNLRSVFTQVLGCNVDAVIQFAYVGEQGLDSKKIQRSNIQEALEMNNSRAVYENYRLCLVGKPALQGNGGHHWKSVIVFLDLLRRCENLHDYLPAVGNLGQNNISFLRYGEFNENYYQQLKKEQRRLEALRTNSNSSALKALVEAKRDEMVDYIEQNYHVDGSLHPQHPDMIVAARRKLFERDMREAARRGQNPAYSKAQEKTREAVRCTGERLRREIDDWFDGQIANAPNDLLDFFEQANVGINLKRNPVEMHSALRLTPYQDPGTMPSLKLSYNLDGAADEIGEYLAYIRKSCICNGIKAYTKALQEAFELIPQADIQAQQKKLERDQIRANQALANALDREGFCQKVALDNPPESVFEINTQMNVKSAKFMLCRNASVAVAEKMAGLGNIKVHGVDDAMCGIKTFDEAPVKAVMIESVECVDEVINQLLPEVDYGF